MFYVSYITKSSYRMHNCLTCWLTEWMSVNRMFYKSYWSGSTSIIVAKKIKPCDISYFVDWERPRHLLAVFHRHQIFYGSNIANGCFRRHLLKYMPPWIFIKLWEISCYECKHNYLLAKWFGIELATVCHSNIWSQFCDARLESNIYIYIYITNSKLHRKRNACPWRFQCYMLF